MIFLFFLVDILLTVAAAAFWMASVSLLPSMSQSMAPWKFCKTRNKVNTKKALRREIYPDFSVLLGWRKPQMDLLTPDFYQMGSFE